ncbi:nuclear transport factor 2 family protein [Streptomyces umbrinus]|uniref:nuclear transport factor 2 family protein n=1 Tax=Streptomyces umbrinus TaxID=67370 RepID=UPI0033C64464
MSDSAEAISERNAEVVRRYLRVFETKEVAEFAELVAEDVLVHGAGLRFRGRHHPEGSVLTPGLSNCRVQVDDLSPLTTGSPWPSPSRTPTTAAAGISP